MGVAIWTFVLIKIIALKYKKGIFVDQETKTLTGDGVHGGHKTLNDTKMIIYNLHHTNGFKETKPNFKKDSISILD